MSSYRGCSIYNSASPASATRILISVQPDAIKMQQGSSGSSTPDRKQLACQTLPPSLVCFFKNGEESSVILQKCTWGFVLTLLRCWGGCEGEWNWMSGGEDGTSHVLGMETPHFQSPWWVCGTGNRL